MLVFVILVKCVAVLKQATMSHSLQVGWKMVQTLSHADPDLNYFSWVRSWSKNLNGSYTGFVSYIEQYRKDSRLCGIEKARQR